MARHSILFAILGMVALTGCSTSHSSENGQPHPPDRAQASLAQPATLRLPEKVLVVIEENHSLAQMRAGMPFLASLSARYGYATDWHAVAHPSEPNYLAIVGGSTFGVTDDGPPAENADPVGAAPSVFGEALRAGKTARTYAQGMGTPCQLTDSYPYAVRHNPWTYFGTERALCGEHDTDATAFPADARHDRLPNVGLLVPDLLHDAHDGSLAAADAWLRSQLAPVLASRDFTSGRLVVVVTADEDDGQAGNVVLTSVLTPRLDHAVVNTPLTHYSLARFIAQVLGVKPPGQAGEAPDFASAFGW